MHFIPKETIKDDLNFIFNFEYKLLSKFSILDSIFAQ